MIIKTKQELFDFLRKAFRNDKNLEKFLSTCTDQKLPDEIPSLLHTGWQWEHPNPDPTNYEYYNNEMPYPCVSLFCEPEVVAKALGIKDYMTFTTLIDYDTAIYTYLDGRTKKFDRAEASQRVEAINNSLPDKMKPYLDKFVGKDGCYVLHNISGYRWKLYLFSTHLSALEFMETDDEKVEFILS